MLSVLNSSVHILNSTVFTFHSFQITAYTHTCDQELHKNRKTEGNTHIHTHTPRNF